MKTPCVHSCRGLCNALTVAEHREEEAIAEYRDYAAACDYPEVRDILETLVRERVKMLALLREQRAALEVKFTTLDRINESFG
jgi:rubrerythrin